jgi:SAM-dependent methyltransferase
MIVISIASKEPHVPNPYAILNRIRLEVGAFGMADASGNDTNSQATHKDAMVQRYLRRQSLWYRLLRPPLPLIANPHESSLPPVKEGPKLFVGGAGQATQPGFLNLDLVYFPGVDLVADIECLPFRDDSIVAIECDAVLEHVRRPSNAIFEFARVLRPGGFLHVVVPFCHPFHEYPRDYQRWTIDGLRELLSEFEIIDIGLRTGPTATLLSFMLEYAKMISPRPFRKVAYGVSCWLLWPLRYLDVWLMQRPEATIMGNHVYALLRKPIPDERHAHDC